MDEQTTQSNLGRVPASGATTEGRDQPPEEVRSALQHAVRTHGRAAVIVLEVSPHYAKRAHERVCALLEKWQRGRAETVHIASTGPNRFALVVAPITFPGHARALAEHLTRSLDPRICPLLRRALPYAWFGLAFHPEDGVDAGILIARADEALARMRSETARRPGIELSRRRHIAANRLRPLAVGFPGSETA